MFVAKTGIMFPCAPKSTRKCHPETLSMMKSNLFELQIHTAASKRQPSHFPDGGMNTEGCNASPLLQTSCCRSRACHPSTTAASVPLESHLVKAHAHCSVRKPTKAVHLLSQRAVILCLDQMGASQCGVNGWKELAQKKEGNT